MKKQYQIPAMQVMVFQSERLMENMYGGSAPDPTKGGNMEGGFSAPARKLYV